MHFRVFGFVAGDATTSCYVLIIEIALKMEGINNDIDILLTIYMIFVFTWVNPIWARTVYGMGVAAPTAINAKLIITV